MGNTANSRRTRGKRRDGGEGLGGVGDWPQVQIDAAQLSLLWTKHLRVPVRDLHLGAHVRQDVDEAEIALGGATTETIDAHAPAGHRRRREEVGRIRGVWFDVVQTARVALPGS